MTQMLKILLLFHVALKLESYLSGKEYSLDRWARYCKNCDDQGLCESLWSWNSSLQSSQLQQCDNSQHVSSKLVTFTRWNQVLNCFLVFLENNWKLCGQASGNHIWPTCRKKDDGVYWRHKYARGQQLGWSGEKKFLGLSWAVKKWLTYYE